jgi:hypothetical protein
VPEKEKQNVSSDIRRSLGKGSSSVYIPVEIRYPFVCDIFISTVPCE